MKRRRQARSAEFINLTAKQANVYSWGWQPAARFRDSVCGRRFGKTYLGAAEMRRAAALAARWNVHPDDEIWYCAPTFKQAKRVFWRRLKRAIPRDWIEGRPNESECFIALKSGHMIRVVGLDSYDNLRGSGLFFVLVDEWADSPYEAWEEVIRPMLATCKYIVDGVLRHGGHALRIGTPKGFNHCYETYLLGQSGGEPDHRSWIYSTLEGGNVPLEEVENARRNLDPRTFRQEYEASFENYSGRVYYAFERKHSVKSCAYDPTLPLHVGMDFNVNPMSATVWQDRPDGDFWQIGEIVIPTSDTGEMARELRNRYGRIVNSQIDVSHVTVYPDPAGAQRKTSAQGKTDFSILQEHGLRVYAMNAHPLVRDRINLVNAKFLSADGKRHAFVDPTCRQSIKCYEQLTYKEGTSEPDKDLGLDHLPDATGYHFYTRFAYKPARGAYLPHMSR